MPILRKFIRRTFPASVDVEDLHFATLAALIERVGTRLDSLEAKFASSDANFASLETRFDSLQSRFEFFHAKLESVVVPSALHRGDDTGSLVTQTDILRTMALVEPRAIAGKSKVRVGSEHDGGYVMLDDFADIGVAFSLGIETNDDWDVAMAGRGIAVKQYDYSVEQAPSTHDLLQFFPLRVGPKCGDGIVTLREMLDDHADEQDAVLKMDIEGSEWAVFDAAEHDTVARFAQIVCEFHHLANLTDPAFQSLVERVFGKLTRTHQVVHVHANNWANLVNVLNVAVPNVLELTFLRRDQRTFQPSNETFPTALDRPNRADMPDIVLGAFRFA